MFNSPITTSGWCMLANIRSNLRHAIRQGEHFHHSFRTCRTLLRRPQLCVIFGSKERRGGKCPRAQWLQFELENQFACEFERSRILHAADLPKSLPVMLLWNPLNWVWLKVLNDSARNSKRARSVNANDL